MRDAEIEEFLNRVHASAREIGVLSGCARLSGESGARCPGLSYFLGSACSIDVRVSAGGGEVRVGLRTSDRALNEAIEDAASASGESFEDLLEMVLCELGAPRERYMVLHDYDREECAFRYDIVLVSGTAPGWPTALAEEAAFLVTAIRAVLVDELGIDPPGA